MGIDFTIKFASIAVSSLLMANVAIVGFLCIPGRMLVDVAPVLRTNLWLITPTFIVGAGLVCFGLYTLRELVKERLSRQLSFRIGIVFAALMWSLPVAGSVLGILAFLAHQNGSGPARVMELALSGFLAWTAAFIFAGALLLEPDARRPTAARGAAMQLRPSLAEYHRWT
jgi:hypothetical protein